MNRIKPHQVFLFNALIFGFLTVWLTPPFKSADEINHFYRAWQVATGTFSSVKTNQRLGGYIPKSMDSLTSVFRPYLLNPYNRMIPNEIWQTRLIKLNPADTIFADYTNTALYPAVLYFPQSLGIMAGKLLKAGPLGLVYYARITNMVVFVLLVYLAILLIPVKKWLITLLALLPMSISVFSSMSADMLVNALSFLTLAFVFNLSFNDHIEKLSYKHILALLLISAWLGLAKLVYLPLVLLILIIPAEKFAGRKARILILLLIISAGAGTALWQKKVIDAKYIPYSGYNADYREYTMLKPGSDISEQMEFIMENPLHTIKAFAKSLCNEFEYLTRSYIGQLGWGDISLPVWFVIAAYLAILITTAIPNHHNEFMGLTWKHRCFFGLVFSMVVILIMVSQYLSWDLVGEDRVYPLQGRYFIPVFPLFFMMFSNMVPGRTGMSPGHSKWVKTIMFFCIFSGGTGLWSVLSGSYTLHENHNVGWEVNSSFRELTRDSLLNHNQVEYILSDRDTVAAFQKPNNFLSAETTYTGALSLILCESNPYGFTTRIFKGRANDRIVVSCRVYGSAGYLVVQEHPEGIYFQSARTFQKKENCGWKYQEVQFVLPHDVSDKTELRVFIWHPGKDSLYVDDFRLTYLTSD